MTDETIYERNKREGWGCACHGTTFCPNLQFVGYENDVPVFEKKPTSGRSSSGEKKSDRLRLWLSRHGHLRKVQRHWKAAFHNNGKTPK